MLIFKRLKVKDIELYHVDNWKRITQTEEYAKLKASIEEEGIKDPLLVQSFPDKLRIEMGEQRLLVCRDLGIEEVDAFVYDVNKSKLRITGETVVDEASALAKCREEIPLVRTLKKYIGAGIIVCEGKAE